MHEGVEERWWVQKGMGEEEGFWGYDAEVVLGDNEGGGVSGVPRVARYLVVWCRDEVCGAEVVCAVLGDSDMHICT